MIPTLPLSHPPILPHTVGLLHFNYCYLYVYVYVYACEYKPTESIQCCLRYMDSGLTFGDWLTPETHLDSIAFSSH